MAERTARVFSIPLGVDFPDTLASAILNGHVLPDWPDRGDPLSLSMATLYMPTRRAARAVSERLAARSNADTLLLPKIIPLGGLEDVEDRILIDDSLAAFFGPGGLPNEIAPVRRRLILARLITAWSEAIQSNLTKGDAEKNFTASLAKGLTEDRNGFVVASTPRDALQLADALGHLIDTLTIHNKTWQHIHDLVPQDLADDYWKISRDFLEIAARAWPEFCASQTVIDAAERQHKLILTEAERLMRDAPSAPMIVAGSTGTMPATAALIAAIARLPNGAVVLPGLDHDLDQISFDALADENGNLIEPQHPQAQLRRLMRDIGVKRSDVNTLGVRDTQRDKRMRFLTEALRPVSTTDQWRSRAERISDADIDDALNDVKIIIAAHEREEAAAIAVALREALETPGKTAALITPDRSLAERVQSELKRWKVDVEDSAGISLARTSAGRLALLSAEALAQNFSPASLLALLAHPDANFGLDRDQRDQAQRALDIGLFRKVSYPSGLDQIEEACHRALTNEIDARRPIPETRLTKSDWASALQLIHQLKTVLTGLSLVGNANLVALLQYHQAALHNIAATPDDPEAWDRAIGASEFSTLVDMVAPSADVTLTGTMIDYPDFLNGLMRGTMVRTHHPSHPRIKIFGLLEARLLSVDLAIVAGLDESVWPPELKTDPFLNRPWREALNLPAPERRIGQTAHDLLSAMGAKEIIMTRALKRGGTPMVASRFLQRMQAVAGEDCFERLVLRGNFYLSCAHNIDMSMNDEAPTRLAAPQPVVSRTYLPTQLSVTSIETLRRDPYSIFARYVLQLDPLKSIEPQIGAAEIGMAFHDALANFGLAYPNALPANARTIFADYGQKAFEALSRQPEFWAFWWPRFERAADWYVKWEETRRSGLAAPLVLEQQGALTIELPHGGQFTLTARADRIEILADNKFSVLDYKTGTHSSADEVRVGFAPQLTLEAAMVQRGAFSNVTATSPQNLSYVKIGTRDGGEENSAVAKGKTADELVTKHFDELVKLIDAHWNGGKPFVSRPIAKFAKKYADYDHLARVKEWSANSDGDEGGDA